MCSSFGLKISAISSTNLSERVASLETLLEPTLPSRKAGKGDSGSMSDPFKLEGEDDSSKDPSKSPRISQETESRTFATAGRRSEHPGARARLRGKPFVGGGGGGNGLGS